MTTLFRQGVESVCKGKRQTDRVPLAEGGPGGPGAGRQAEHRLGAGSEGPAGPEQYWVPQGGARQLLCGSQPLLPTADDHTSRACAPGSVSHGAICWVGKHLPASFCHSFWSSLQDGRGGWEWDLVCIYFTPSCHKTPFLTAWAPEVQVVQKCNCDVGLGCAHSFREMVTLTFDHRSAGVVGL